MNDSVRKTVSFTEQLELAIARRAKKYDRSFSAQVAYDMRTIIEREKNRRITVVDKIDQKRELPDAEK